MSPASPSRPEPAETLTVRKQRRARQRIIEAADDLFASRGYDDVSVSDIAERAEVGRTTFFRYFGDKTEVVFAKEQAMLDAVARAGMDESVETARDIRAAIEQLRPIVLELCEEASEDPDAYERHSRLLDRHVELRARDALKAQQIATRLTEILRHRGTPEKTAVLASQVALACYETARQRVTSARQLLAETRAAFREVLALGDPGRADA
ncbi:TetR/AcrR family transcriptional regulator [Microbacterium sp. RD1]|uniref:TetR/AcrR family transcriptional regulator n=1 Tax=Microbacterium sp. RD1 TaxID=3457313 RepID=UPI003FA599E3